MCMLQKSLLSLAAVAVNHQASCSFLAQLGSQFYFIAFIVMFVSLAMAVSAAAALPHGNLSSSNTTENDSILTLSPWMGPLQVLKAYTQPLIPCLKHVTSPSSNSLDTVMFASTATTILSRNHPPLASTAKLDMTAAAILGPRSKTSFQIAYPPPSGNSVIGRQRLKMRSRLLLQLHHLSASTRPIPALDVLPAMVFAPMLTRKFPAILKRRNGFGINDLVVINSEEYSASTIRTEHRSDDVRTVDWDARTVVATISQSRNDEGLLCGKSEICLDQGLSWTGMPLPNGGYEIVYVEQKQPITARWVPRTSNHQRRSSLSHGTSLHTVAPGERYFQFSIINPNTRRHPIIATMTHNHISIYDKYPRVPVAYLPSSQTRAFSLVEHGVPSSSYFSESPVPTMINTEDCLRSLIVVTGIWIAFRENWTKSFWYENYVNPTISSPHVSSSMRRCATSSINHGTQSVIRSSDGKSQHLKKPNHDIREAVQAEPEGLKRAPATTSCVPHFRTHVESIGDYPRRANSTGSAFIRKANIRACNATNGLKQLHSARISTNELNSADNSARVSTVDSRVDSGTFDAGAPISLLADTHMREREKVSRYCNTGESRPESAHQEQKSREETIHTRRMAIDRDGKLELPKERRWSRIKGLFHSDKRIFSLC